MLTKEQMQNLTKEQKEIINEYAKDNNKKLKNICNQIRSTSIDQADYDDLYCDDEKVCNNFKNDMALWTTDEPLDIATSW